MNDDVKHRSISFPVWALTLLKMVVPAVVAILTMYVRIASVEKDLIIQKAQLTKLESLDDAHAEMIRNNASHIGSMETKASLSETYIRDALSRIESDVKDVKGDVKNMQQRLAPR